MSIPGRENHSTEMSTPNNVLFGIKGEVANVSLLLFLTVDGAFENKVIKVKEVDVPCVSYPHTLLGADYTINCMF
jgi:hypothetical protein